MTAGYYHTNLLRKRWGIVLIAILVSSFAYAQKISVSRFYLAESDLTAQTKGTIVEDQNGDKCALIRIQTTQKGFSFDVGTAGVQKVEDNHDGETWVYVPYGVRHISIRHPQLGSLPNYDFPISIQKARTYIMEITSDKVFVNYYDDTRKQKLNIRVVPANASFTLNGMNVELDSEGSATQELSFGTYTYKVSADNYYPKEGQIVINDSAKAQQLVVSDLMPIMGKLSVHVNPYNAEVLVDGVAIPSNTSLTPYSVQTGRHKVTVRLKGYKTEVKTVVVKQDSSTDVSISLSQVTTFTFWSAPSGANLSINGRHVSTTPCQAELKTGTYIVALSKSGYKDIRGRLSVSSSTPYVGFKLRKIYNPKNEIYLELGARVGSFVGFGGSLGGYISNINLELSGIYGIGSSETIYWSCTDSDPVSSVYHPEKSFSGKVGYGIALGTRFKLTPQVGINYLQLREEMQEDTNLAPAKGSNVLSALTGLRFSAVIANHFGLSLSPEYSFALGKSKGYKELETVSAKIKKWGHGFNVKLSLMATF